MSILLLSRWDLCPQRFLFEISARWFLSPFESWIFFSLCPCEPGWGFFSGDPNTDFIPPPFIPRPLGHKLLSNPFLQQRGSRGRRDLPAKTLSNQLDIYISPPSPGKFWKTTTNTRWQSEMKVCLVGCVPTIWNYSYTWRFFPLFSKDSN